jgi:alpha-mannosidase
VVADGEIFGQKVIQEIVLYNETAKIDIHTKIKWNGEGNVRIQQKIPYTHEEPDITYGVPFGSNNLDNIQPNTGPRLQDEIDMESWIKIREIVDWIRLTDKKNNEGLIITSNRRLVEFDEGSISINLLVGAQHQQISESNTKERVWYPPADVYSNTISIFLAKNQEDIEKAYRFGWQKRFPIQSIASYDTVSDKTLDNKHSYLRVSGGENVVLTAMKMAEADNDIVLRFVEMEGKKSRIRLAFNDGDVLFNTIDLTERIYETDQMSEYEMKPYEISTFKVQIQDNL